MGHGASGQRAARAGDGARTSERSSVASKYADESQTRAARPVAQPRGARTG